MAVKTLVQYVSLVASPYAAASAFEQIPKQPSKRAECLKEERKVSFN